MEEANADDTKAPSTSPKIFSNFQKNGKIIPNINSITKRPAGISKGLWKKEAKRQLTGSVDKKERRGKRVKKDAAEGGVLGKRTKTATSHSRNTSTFKTQKKQRK